MEKSRGDSRREIRCKDHPFNTIEECSCQIVETPWTEKSRVDEHIAVKLYDILRTRRRYFQEGIFGDPAWTVLLKLFIAEKAQEPVHLAEVCTITDMPAPAASRWMKILVHNGHVTRHGEEEGAAFTLTRQARSKLAALFAEFEDRQA